MKGGVNNNQVVGNIGLFFVCYRLSRLGWNVMPTARNARGIDVLIYSQDAKRTRTIQVKTLSQRTPVPLGTKLDGIFGDFLIVCRFVLHEIPERYAFYQRKKFPENSALAAEIEIPECFILKPREVCALAHRGEKEGRISFWLQPKHYEQSKYRETWSRIGSGSASMALSK